MPRQPVSAAVRRQRLALRIADAVFDVLGLSRAQHDLGQAAATIYAWLPLTRGEAEELMLGATLPPSLPASPSPSPGEA